VEQSSDRVLPALFSDLTSSPSAVFHSGATRQTFESAAAVLKAANAANFTPRAFPSKSREGWARGKGSPSSKQGAVDA
jgi:hypothetical protein